MRAKLIICTFFLGFSILAVAQWQTITPFGGNINDVYFLNSRDGIAVGQQAGIGSCSAPCFISRTIDGGQNWIRLFPSGISTTTLNTVDFSGNNGLACGSSSVVLKTADAGYTWSQVGAGVGSGYNDIAFTGTNTAVVIGNNGLIRFSSNAGNTWNTVASGVTGTLNSISYIGNGIVFIGGSNGILLKSTNSGNSWNVVNTGITNSISRLCFVSQQEAYFAAGSTIYKTTNGGTSWTSQSLNLNGFIRKIRFQNPQLGYFVTDAGEWGVTTDAGQSWTIRQTGYLQSLYSFRFIDPSTIVACGDKGIFLRSNDGGQTWASQLSGIADEQFGLLIQDKDLVWSCGKNGSVFRSQNAGFNWQRIKTGTTGVFLNISKINANKVLLCADSGRIFLGDKNSFQLEEVFIDSVGGIKDAWFNDSLNGWACSTGPDVYRTNDGGHTWWYLSSVSVGETLKAIQFLNDSIGFAAGNNGVYKTGNGGLTWTYIAFSNTNSIEDLRFFGDSIGYCAGGFGKMMKTEDQGNFWFESNPSQSGNVNATSISLINDSTVFIASNQSQRISINGGMFFGSQSTACLANNWSTHAIDVISPDTLGFCTGGLSGLMHKLSYPRLNAVVTDRNAYCSNESIEVFYRGSGLAFNNWSFNIQLSDAFGSFNNPTSIGTGTFNQLNYMVSGLVRCVIPGSMPAGSGYRVRVVCSNPSLVSPDNGYDIAISNTHFPSASLSGDLQGCAGDIFAFSVQEFAGGSSPQWTWYVNDSLVQQGGTQLQWPSANTGFNLYVRMNSSLQCASPTVVFSDTLSPVLLLPPTLTASNDTIVCPGGLVQLQAQSPQPVTWFPQGFLNNDTINNPFWVANQSMVFRVESGPSGCSSSDSISIALFSTLQASIGGLSTQCPGSCTQLTSFISGVPVSINWSPPGVFSNPSLPDPLSCLVNNTWISLTVTDSNNCATKDSAYGAVYPLAGIPIISQQGDTLTTTGYDYYQWVLNGSPLIGATDSNYVVQQEGSYWVVGTDSNGCTSVSDTISVLISGLNQKTHNDLFISPVPAISVLQIQCMNHKQNIDFILYSATGLLIKKYTNQTIPIALDVHSLKDGFYILEINDNGRLERKRFIKTSP